VAVDISSPAALDASAASGVRALAESIERRDGQPPLSDRALTRLTSRDVQHRLARDGDRIVGYGQVDSGAAEVALGEDSAGVLLDELDATIDEIWSHGVRSVLRPLLSQRGYVASRVLHQLRRPGDLEVTEPHAPSDVRLATFRAGADEQAWLGVNAAAFAHHPEQGGVTLDDLLALEAEGWFSADGFFLAWRGEDLVGYHWTKVHPDGNGEVYVLGISPAAQGLGLGRVLLDVGLRHLAEVGCPEVLLYVDESNTGAMHLYESVGFVRFDADTQWTRG